jgi:hypothetical protein
MKKSRSAGELLRLQGDLIDAMAANLGELMMATDLIVGGHGSREGGVVPPGLEGGGTDKNPVDISKLVTRLRLRAAE